VYEYVHIEDEMPESGLTDEEIVDMVRYEMQIRKRKM
jgi:hypothetical protein